MNAHRSNSLLSSRQVRGFSNAMLRLSGENASLPTVPRVVSSRIGAVHGASALARVELTMLLRSSVTQAARSWSGERAAEAGGTFSLVFCSASAAIVALNGAQTA